MKTRLSFFLASFLFLTAPALRAQDSIPVTSEAPAATPTQSPSPEPFMLEEVVVTANRWETSRREVASSMTVITKKDLERKQQPLLSGVLRDIPALDLSQTGGVGGNTSVFMRGAADGNTLVLVDGVEMNDPTSTSRNYDFSQITTENLDRVEVLRGPQSTLYGSDASGGVIQVFTRKGDGRPRVSLTTQGGSLGTMENSLSSSGGMGWARYSGSLSRYSTNGVSSAGKDYGNLEDDGNRVLAGSFRADLAPLKNLEGALVFRSSQARTDLDNNSGTGGDDPNYITQARQQFWRAQAGYKLLDGRLEQRAGYSYSRHKREFENGTDPDHPQDSSLSHYNGDVKKADWEGHFRVREGHSLILGAETEEETAKSDYSSESQYGPYNSTFDHQVARTNGFYAQVQSGFSDRLFLSLGAREDRHDRFGSRSTYRAAPAFLFPAAGTKLRGSFATGFKAPSLYQLYEPSFGDPGLKPEKSEGWDFGLDQELSDGRVRASATYFRNLFREMIDFTSKYANVAAAVSRGVELDLSWRPLASLRATGSWTWQESRNETTRDPLLKRPKQKGGLDLAWQWKKDAGLSLGAVHTGKRLDFGSKVPLPDYTVLNLSGSWSLVTRIRIFGRVDNLLDKRHEEVRGYGSTGRSFFAGTSLSL